MRLYSATHPYNHGREEYIINLGYNNLDTNLTVTVTFHNKGIYRASDVRAVCQLMTLVNEQTAERRKTVLGNVALKTDTVTGTVNADKDTFLCVTIPYSRGWAAYIDGDRTEIFKTQEMFLGMEVPKGIHTIRLEYRTPGQGTGMALSVIGLLLLIGIIVSQHRSKQV